MTPEQVSALSDTELNRAMIWLYYMGFDINYNPHIDQYVDYKRIVDYLTDYNLTMPLVIERKIRVNPDPYQADLWKAFRCIRSRNFSSLNARYLRAACECLVLIALDKNNRRGQ